MLLIKAKPGQDVYSFATQLVATAKALNEPVEGRHNEHVLTARPGMTPMEVLQPWNDAQRESYLNR